MSKSLATPMLDLVRRVGATRLGVLVIGRVVSPLQRALYQATGGRVAITGRAPVLLLTTTGRRTGLLRTVPLLYVRDGDRFVVCNVNPGFEGTNPWVLNIRADPRARIQVGQQVLEVTAHAADDGELERYWPRLVRLWPAYRTFEEHGGQRAVFVLEPTGRCG